MHHHGVYGRRQIFSASAAVIVAVLLFVPAVLADGLPTPLPGSEAGPDPGVITSILTIHGLVCQPDQSVGGVAESFCQSSTDTAGLIFSATYYADPTLVLVATVSGPSPLGIEADAFLNELAVAFCPTADTLTIASFIAGDLPVIPPSPGLPAILEGDHCRLQLTFSQSPGRAGEFMTAFWRGPAFFGPSPIPTVPTPTLIPPTATLIPPTPTLSPPTTTPSPSPTVRPTAPGQSAVPGGVETGGGPPSKPGSFYQSIPPPAAVSTDPIVVVESLALAALVVLLMPFPAQLFNSTLETHYAEVRRWFRLDAMQKAAGRFGGFWESAAGLLLFILLASIIYGLLDPGLGLNAESLAQVLGLALGLAATTAVASAAGILAHVRAKDRWQLRALPATLLIGLVCVVISRVTGFLPGYVYGIILGVVFGTSLSRAQQGRSNAIAAAVMLAVGLLSWILLAVVTGSIGGLLGIVLSTVLATLLVACLEGVVFGLLPFRFLPGEPLFETNRLLWAALLGLGAFAFFHILINPQSGYLSSTSTTPFITIVLLFLVFAGLSVGFWAYFRNRPVQA